VAVRPEVELRQPPSDVPSFTVGVPYLSISNRTPTVMEGISPRQATSRIELLRHSAMQPALVVDDRPVVATTCDGWAKPPTALSGRS
jgi:hypothetical protein